MGKTIKIFLIATLVVTVASSISYSIWYFLKHGQDGVPECGVVKSKSIFKERGNDIGYLAVQFGPQDIRILEVANEIYIKHEVNTPICLPNTEKMPLWHKLLSAIGLTFTIIVVGVLAIYCFTSK